MALTPAEMHRIVDDLYAATGQGDFATAASMLTDDFFITEADGLPMAGIYRGPNALGELFSHVMGIMDVASLDRHAITTGDDMAIVHLSFTFADPALKPAELCEMFRFRGHKVCEIRPYYFDPATMTAAVAAKASATV